MKSRFAVTYFALFAIYGVASPYLQILLRGMGYGPTAVGFFLGFFEVTGIVGPLLLSGRADTSGRFKPTLFACAALTFLPLAPLVLLHGPFATAICLALIALGLRSMVPVMDSATVAMSSARKGWEYGKIRAMGSAGFVAVALVLQILPGFAHSPPGRIAIWIGVLAAAFGLCVVFLPDAGRPVAGSVPAARTPAARTPAARTPAADARPSAGPTAFPAGRARGSPGVFALGLVVIALGRLAMAPVNSFLSLYLVDEVKWNAVGGMWALAALSEIPLMILSGKIVARIGPMRATVLGTAAIAVRLAIYAAFPSPAGTVAAQLLHSLCFGLLHPAGVAFVATMVRPERRTLGMAAYLGLGVGLPTFAGSALGGIVLQGWGYRVLFGSFIVFALAALALYAAARRKLASA